MEVNKDEAAKIRTKFRSQNGDDLFFCLRYTEESDSRDNGMTLITYARGPFIMSQGFGDGLIDLQSR